MLDAKAKDQGHKRKCSPKKKKKKGLHKNFSSDLQKKKKGLHKNFSSDLHKKTFSIKILTIQKIVLYSSRGQANFRGLEALRPRTSKCVLEDSTSGVNIKLKNIHINIVFTISTTRCNDHKYKSAGR